MKLLSLIAVFLSLAPACCRAAEAAGSTFDMQGFIDHQVAAGHKRIVIPPGRYRVKPVNGVHLRLTGLHDVKIVADRVEMVCTETTCAIAMENCTGLTLHGLAIDYDPLPYSEGVIVALSPDKSAHTIELFEGYPDSSGVKPTSYEIYRAGTRTLRCDTYWAAGVDVLGPRRIRLRKGSGSPNDPEQVGDVVTIASVSAPGGVVPHAVTLTRCKDTRIVDVKLWASNAFGFLEQQCDHSTYLRCFIDRRRSEDDPVKRAAPRIRSLNADAFHSLGAAHGPSIIGCTARFMGDDAVNIHGFYSMVVSCKGSRLRILHDGMPPARGDRVEVCTLDGARVPDAVVVDCAPDSDITPAERAYLIPLPMHEPMRRFGFTHGETVTLDRSVDLPMGSLIAPLRLMGNGFLVKGCNFGFNRSRGIVIKASDGQVIGNRIEGGWMAAVLVSPEVWWMEAGSASRVRVARNAISGCKRTPIVIEAPSRFGKVAPAGAHRDIRVEGNTISDCASPAIRITSVKGLVFRGNRISGPATGAVQIEQCEDVTPPLGLAAERNRR